MCDRVHRMLLEWAQWLGAGRASAGFPRTNVLHESWSPAQPGRMPEMLASRGDAHERRVHELVGKLSQRLSDTVVLHYCNRLPVAQQALMLGCQPSTVHARVSEAHRLIGEWLNQ